MAVIWVEQTEDQRMNGKQINDTRERLVAESEKLIRAINRNRAAEEITTESTEDEGDLATISHNKEVLYVTELSFVLNEIAQKAG
jgi:hypothetical protein